jgi:hypothetical protein
MKEIIKVYVEPHDGANKTFDFIIEDKLAAQIDYDDVNHPEVDAATRVLQNIIEKHWDEKLFKRFLREEVIKVWDENEYGLQDDYEGVLKDFLADNGIKS